MSIYTMGIDVGSTASKCVILKDGSEIVAKSLVAVGTGTSGPSRAIAQVLENAGMTREQMDFVLATGYGRNSLDGLADMLRSELSCHAKGAAFLFPNVRTVVDIGGQDVKVIEIENGMMKNFVMNDKCAAGTGRFLEIMADRLGITQQQMADLARSGEPTKISSMCTVFAESEVISLIGRGEPRENIARGVIDSVVSRVATMAGQAAGAPYYLTGGLCENAFVVERLGELLGSPVTTSPQARFAGAIGAAVRAAALA